MQAIRRFISTTWLVAAPLVVVALLVAIPLCLGIVGAIVGRVFGPQAAEAYGDILFGAMMWAAELALLLAPIGLAAYGLFRLAQWLGKKEP